MEMTLPLNLVSRTRHTSLVLISFILPLLCIFTLDNLLLGLGGNSYESLPRVEFFYVAWPVLTTVIGIFFWRKGSKRIGQGLLLNALFVGLIVLSYFAISSLWTMSISGWLPV